MITGCDGTDSASDELSDYVIAACSPFTTSLSENIAVVKSLCIDVFYDRTYEREVGYKRSMTVCRRSLL